MRFSDDDVVDDLLPLVWRPYQMYKIDIKLQITESRQTLGLSSTDDVFVSEVILTSSSARVLVLTDGGTPTHWRKRRLGNTQDRAEAERPAGCLLIAATKNFKKTLFSIF